MESLKRRKHFIPAKERGNTPISLTPSSGNNESPLEKYLEVGTNHDFIILKYDKATDEKAFWQFGVPSHLAGINLKVNIWWYGTLITGAVRWKVTKGDIASGSVADIALGDWHTTSYVDSTVAGTTKQLVKATLTSDSAPFTAGKQAVLCVERVGSAVEDTLDEDACLYMVEIETA